MWATAQKKFTRAGWSAQRSHFEVFTARNNDFLLLGTASKSTFALVFHTAELCGHSAIPHTVTGTLPAVFSSSEPGLVLFWGLRNQPPPPSRTGDRLGRNNTVFLSSLHTITFHTECSLLQATCSWVTQSSWNTNVDIRHIFKQPGLHRSVHLIWCNYPAYNQKDTNFFHRMSFHILLSFLPPNGNGAFQDFRFQDFDFQDFNVSGLWFLVF